MALQYASQRLKDDREVVLAAVSLNGMAVQYASKDLKADKEVLQASKKVAGLNIALAGFFAGGAAIGATLYFSISARAFVTNLMSFLPQAAAMGISVEVCGIAIALLALVVSASISNCVEAASKITYGNNALAYS